MKNIWSDKEAASFIERYGRENYNQDIALRIYSSRLIGSDPSLVLHGGGNTSVKTRVLDDLGHDTEVICVKASGRDLAYLSPKDLPALRYRTLLELRNLAILSDEQLLNAQRTRMLNASGPNPSVEALLHVFLPHKFIDHSHADAILAIINQEDAEDICKDTFEDRLATVPYLRSGFNLAKLAAEINEANPKVEGLLLLQHGLVTFGDSARESYIRHVDAVDTAESFCRKRRYWITHQSIRPIENISYTRIAPILRGRLGTDGRSYVLCHRQSGAIREFVDNSRLLSLSQRGVATPDHIIRTKRVPLVLNLSEKHSDQEISTYIEECVGTYRRAYSTYVENHRSQAKESLAAIDPDPRVILVPGLGLVTAGTTLEESHIAADITEHTIEIIQNADSIGEYRGLSEANSFDFEYWSLEQAKLDRTQKGSLTGQVVYITGAASGIGAATARLFVQEGACVYLVDRDAEPLERLASQFNCPFEVLDVKDEITVRLSIDRAVNYFGGLDGVVSNAGYAPQSPIDDCPTSLLQQSMELNLYSHQFISSRVMQVLRKQGKGGFLLYNASKAAFNPGAGFGPYAIPKAALIALMKQYAIEGGPFGIRSNALNADRIRTGLFSPQLIMERAQARGIEPDDYFKANLLGREVTAEDVAQAFLNLALSLSTTGCVITVDGGNIAASPR